jgi:glycosyltransferase involved in cell wall biosynthesis
MKVSVIIPAFNSRDYILEAIDSVRNQTLRAHEIIVVDDGSSDGSVELLRSIDDVILVAQSNNGPSSARNAGVRVATGELIAFLDSDDLWFPKKLEVQLGLLCSNSALVYSNRLNFGRVGMLSEIQSDAVTLYQGNVFRELLIHGNFVTMSSALMRKKLFIESGGFFEDASVRGVEDWDLWLRLSRCGTFERSMDPLVKYRIHSSGISRNIRRMCEAQLSVIDRVQQSFFDEGVRIKRRDVFQSKANTYETWAFFAMNEKRYMLAIDFYLKSIRISPLNRQSWKGLAKSLLCLGRFL